MESNAAVEITALQAEVVTKIQPIVSEASDIAARIKDDATFADAGAYLMKIKGARKFIEEKFEPVVRKALDAHRAAVALRKEADEPLNRAEAIIKPAMVKYQTEQERARQTAEAAARAVARKLEEDARLARAAELEQQGETKAAEAVLERPAFVPTIVLPSTQKVAGVSFRESWMYEVTDLMALVKAAAAGTVPLTAILPNEKVLGQMARSLKSELAWPGVRVWSEKTVAAGAMR